MMRTYKKKSFEDRMLEHVMPEPNTGCWIWTGFTDRDGYGRAASTGKSPQPAHRWVYSVMVGDIPRGLHLDHKCKQRCCVNPDHLEPVTPRENLMRSQTLQKINAEKTHCIHGHPFNEENTYFYNGYRSCVICRKRNNTIETAKRLMRRRALKCQLITP